MTNLNKSLLALCMALGMAGTAAAQTCATPRSFLNPGTAPTSSDSTCTTGTAVLGDICGAFFENPSPDIIYQFSINPAGPNGYTASTITISTTTAAYNPLLALLGPGGNCDANASCTRTAAGLGAGVAEALDVAGLAAGSYYLIVSGEGNSNCGEFTITANGSLPVQLKNFAID